MRNVRQVREKKPRARVTRHMGTSRVPENIGWGGGWLVYILIYIFFEVGGAGVGGAG